MKKRIAKKIYRRVSDLLWSSAACFLYYTTVDVFGKFYFKDRPNSAIYSRDQFARALKVLGTRIRKVGSNIKEHHQKETQEI